MYFKHEVYSGKELPEKTYLFEALVRYAEFERCQTLYVVERVLSTDLKQTGG